MWDDGLQAGQPERPVQIQSDHPGLGDLGVHELERVAAELGLPHGAHRPQGARGHDQVVQMPPWVHVQDAMHRLFA